MDDHEAIVANHPDRDVPLLAIVGSIVSSSDHLTFKDKSRVQEIHIAFRDRLLSLSLVPFKDQERILKRQNSSLTQGTQNVDIHQP